LLLALSLCVILATKGGKWHHNILWCCGTAKRDGFHILAVRRFYEQAKGIYRLSKRTTLTSKTTLPELKNNASKGKEQRE